MSSLHDARMQLRRELESPPPLRRFGSGWVSGVIGLVLGVTSLSLVISFRFPGLLAMPERRPLQLNLWFRVGLHATLIIAFGLALLSLVLRRGKILGLVQDQCLLTSMNLNFRRFNWRRRVMTALMERLSKAASSLSDFVPSSCSSASVQAGARLPSS
jgi:hypothetical protein